MPELHPQQQLLQEALTKGKSWLPENKKRYKELDGLVQLLAQISGLPVSDFGVVWHSGPQTGSKELALNEVVSVSIKPITKVLFRVVKKKDNQQWYLTNPEGGTIYHQDLYQALAAMLEESQIAATLVWWEKEKRDQQARQEEAQRLQKIRQAEEAKREETRRVEWRAQQKYNEEVARAQERAKEEARRVFQEKVKPYLRAGWVILALLLIALAFTFLLRS